MKKFLQVLGIVFLFLLVLGSVVLGYSAYQVKKLNAASKDYVERNIPPILRTWSQDALVKNASPRLVKLLTDKPEALAAIFQKTKILGEFERIVDIKGGSNTSVTTQYGRIKSARYELATKFTNGDATVTVVLMDNSGQWQIEGFFINSPKFLQP